MEARETMNDTISDATYSVAAEELRAFIERYERLEAEKKDIVDAQKEVMAEAKGRGYDTKVLRKVISLRKRDKDDIAEEEAVLEMYKAALGMI
jgi:uncharacterized protein (UPF0335 family)